MNRAHLHVSPRERARIINLCEIPTLPVTIPDLRQQLSVRSVKTRKDTPLPASGVFGQRVRCPFSFTVSKRTLSSGIEVTINLKYSSASEGFRCPFVYVVSRCSLPGSASGGTQNTDNINEGENQQSGRGCIRGRRHHDMPELGCCFSCLFQNTEDGLPKPSFIV